MISLILTLTLCAVSYFNRSFVKLHVGPIYILEIIFAVLAVLILAQKPRKFFATWVERIALVILAYGAVRLLYDLKIRTNEPIARVLQHFILCMYPAMWIGVGAAMSRLRPSWVERSALIVAAVTAISYLFNIYGNFEMAPATAGIGSNFSFGPLAAVPAAWFFARKEKPWLCVALILLAFLPYWILLHDSMKRLTLLQLSITLFLVPALVHRSFAKAFQDAVILGLILVAGGLVSLQFSKQDAASTFLGSIQHNDDKHWYAGGGPPIPGQPTGEPIIQARTRRFWWSCAISDWKKGSLALGRGWLVEIPSMYFEWLPNDGNFSRFGEMKSVGNQPITGPHNSYITVLARTGIVGAVLFAALISSILMNCFRASLRAPDSLGVAITLALIMNGFVYATLGIGFESPYNCFALWLMSGAIAVLPERKTT